MGRAVWTSHSTYLLNYVRQAETKQPSLETGTAILHILCQGSALAGSMLISLPCVLQPETSCVQQAWDVSSSQPSVLDVDASGQESQSECLCATDILASSLHFASEHG
eukprot:1239519-Amphidinium_carterae.1